MYDFHACLNFVRELVDEILLLGKIRFWTPKSDEIINVPYFALVYSDVFTRR